MWTGIESSRLLSDTNNNIAHSINLFVYLLRWLDVLPANPISQQDMRKNSNKEHATAIAVAT